MENDFEANFFTLHTLLDAESRIAIDSVCKRSSFGPNETIYKQGDESFSVYIVVSGIVEVITHSRDDRMSRSVTHLKKGDFFGDMGVLTGQVRLAEIRTCEPTQVLEIEKLMFIRMLDKIPKLGAFFARNLAKRLHRTTSEADKNIYSLDLSGNLQHFDLLTIFQAIITAHRTGELLLNNLSNEMIGGFFFQEGRVVNARFEHLEGVEAIWQGFFDSCVEGVFAFRIMEKPTLPFKDELKIELPSGDMIMQGAQRRDMYGEVPEQWRKMQGKLIRKGETLQWSDPETAQLAERIWELTAKRPQHLDSLWRRLNYSSLTFLQVIGTLMESGQAEVEFDPIVAEPEVTTEPGKPVFPTPDKFV